MQGLAQKYYFANCIGVLDAGNVRIQCPSNSRSDYFNYKVPNSLVMLAVVDATCRFVLVDMRESGRQSDGDILKGVNATGPKNWTGTRKSVI